MKLEFFSFNHVIQQICLVLNFLCIYFGKKQQQKIYEHERIRTKKLFCFLTQIVKWPVYTQIYIYSWLKNWQVGFKSHINFLLNHCHIILPKIRTTENVSHTNKTCKWSNKEVKILSTRGTTMIHKISKEI